MDLRNTRQRGDPGRDERARRQGTRECPGDG